MSEVRALPNAPLLRQVLEHIEAHPRQWSQGDWRVDLATVGGDCGTAYCFAGWTCQLDGVKWAYGADDGDASDVIALPDGDLADAATYARALLGLTRVQASRLFHGHNTLADLRRIVGELVEQAEAGDPR